MRNWQISSCRIGLESVSSDTLANSATEESVSGTLDSDSGLSIALFSVEFLILPSNSVAVW